MLSLLLYGLECWVVSAQAAENMRPGLFQRLEPQEVHSDHAQGHSPSVAHHTRKHHISTEELEAKLGIHDIIRHYVHSRVLSVSVRDTY